MRFSKGLFSSLYHSLSWSNKFCNGRGERDSLVTNAKGPWQRNTVLMYIYIYIYLSNVFHSYEEKRKKDKIEENFQNWPFWTYIKKNQHIHFLVHGHFSWSTFGLHLIKGPETLRMQFLEIEPWKCYHEVWPWKKALWTWDNFMVHDVSNPLVLST